MLLVAVAGCGPLPDPAPKPPRPLLDLVETQRAALARSYERELDRLCAAPPLVTDQDTDIAAVEFVIEALECRDENAEAGLAPRAESLAFVARIADRLDGLQAAFPVALRAPAPPFPDLAAEYDAFQDWRRDTRDWLEAAPVRCGDVRLSLRRACRAYRRSLDLRNPGRRLTLGPDASDAARRAGIDRAEAALFSTAEACGYVDWPALAAAGGAACFPASPQTP
ncbi:MAG: hypothetical protein AAF748_12190 [Pseudomonadota bacterium]